MNDKPKILYVDDEVINTQLFRIAFSKTFHILIADSGMEGLEILRKNPDTKFVISDMKMPIMNGLEFIYEIKRINSQLPCMLLSGYHKTPEIIEALNNGSIVAYMTKPFNKPKIEDLIEEHLNSASA